MAGLAVEITPILNDNYVYILEDEATGAVGVVDPGEAEPVAARIEARGGRLDRIFLTHHHGDHIAGVDALRERFGASVVGAAADRARLPDLDEEYVEGDVARLGGAEALVLETPGHSRGHIVYWFRKGGAVFSGDTLFVMGCGRLFEGDAPTMWESLGKFAQMPDDTAVYCGHEYTLANARFSAALDPEHEPTRSRLDEIEALRARGAPTVPTTLGRERATNPFLRADDPALAQRLGLGHATPAAVFAAIRARKDQG